MRNGWIAPSRRRAGAPCCGSRRGEPIVRRARSPFAHRSRPCSRGNRDGVVVDHNDRRRIGRQPECSDLSGDIDVCIEIVYAQHQQHIIASRECCCIGAQQHLRRFALPPFEDREEGESPGNAVRRSIRAKTRRIVPSGITTIGRVTPASANTVAPQWPGVQISSIALHAATHSRGKPSTSSMVYPILYPG